MRKSWLMACGVVACALAVLVFGSATAGAQITVGQVAPSVLGLVACNSGGGYDEAQKQVTGGASYTVPSAGVLTSWSTRSEIGGKLGLKVYRPVLGGYLIVAADGPRTLSPGSINTFPVSIPVQPGDLVGSTVPGGTTVDCVFETGLSGDQLIYSAGNQPVGATVPLADPEGGFRLNILASLLPAPTIASIAPSSGQLAGGNVTIAGSNFASVSAVSFGGVPASSYTVNSESQITAVAPARKQPGSVPVTVTTAAGTASSVQAYSYLACIVPKLKGKSLKAAKKAIKKAGCKVGKVTKLEGATGKTGRVSKQSPKSGKAVATGTKVKITLKPAK